MKRIALSSLIIAILTSIIYEWSINRQYCWNGAIGYECLPNPLHFITIAVIIFLISAIIIYLIEKYWK